MPGPTNKAAAKRSAPSDLIGFMFVPFWLCGCVFCYSVGHGGPTKIVPGCSREDLGRREDGGGRDHPPPSSNSTVGFGSRLGRFGPGDLRRRCCFGWRGFAGDAC